VFLFILATVGKAFGFNFLASAASVNFYNFFNFQEKSFSLLTHVNKTAVCGIL